MLEKFRQGSLLLLFHQSYFDWMFDPATVPRQRAVACATNSSIGIHRNRVFDASIPVSNGLPRAIFRLSWGSIRWQTVLV